jgi:hypothetical protein
MKILDVTQGSDEWRNFREEKISGTKIGKLFAKSRKAGEIYDTEKPNLQFYEILAERLSVGAADAISATEAMERGIALENEAIAAAAEKLGLDVDDVVMDCGVWVSDEDEHWICSPDAHQSSDKPKWAMEVKCLSAANHVKAIVENKIPSDYHPQVLNYFLVNPDLKTLYFVMYDPRFLVEDLQLKIFPVWRKDVIQDVEQMRAVRDIAESKITDLVQKLKKGVGDGQQVEV